MSKQVDERVVEMRFDNANFERNAQQSLSTLEKLKNALSFKGAKDGLKDIDNATRSVNMNGLASSVETVGSKFSALQVIGVTALATITNQAIHAGEALIRSLSIDQISAGWTKYAEKTTAVQTIMAATSSAFDDAETQMAAVNEQLERLSWFTDETSYNFVDMVSNIGKFTSNNIALEKSVTSMQGIATWAAISGANSMEASRAMYNLSQAIGVGAVTAMDWKSIENANMATAEFKKTVIETAESMGTLVKVGDGLYETLDGNAVSIANFRDALKDKWFTNDVLTSTLDKYGAFTNKLNDAYNETGKLTSEILDDIDRYKAGTIDYAKATEDASVSAERYQQILSELGDESLDFGRKAFKAAQETKTFAEVIDYTKDAVSSQWMGIFESMFGDYAGAKKLWTAMSEDFYTLFVEPLENVRSVIEGAFSSKWSELTSKITGAGLSMGDFESNLRSIGSLGGKTLDELIDQYGSLEAAISSGAIAKGFIRDALNKTIDKALAIGQATDTVTKSVVNLEDTVKRVIRGEFGNGVARMEALAKAGYDYATVQDMVDKTMAGMAVDYNIVTEAQLKSMGYTDEQIQKIKELQKEVNAAGGDFNKLLDQVRKPSGRELFTSSIQNGLQIIIRSIEIIKNAWHNVFPATTSEQIYRFLEVVHNFTEGSLVKLDRNAENIGKTLSGVFNILDLIVRLFKGGFRTAIKLVNRVLGVFDLNIWDITAALGDWLTHIHDVIVGSERVTGVLDGIIGVIAAVIGWIIKFVKQIGVLDKARALAEKFAKSVTKAFESTTQFFKTAGEYIREFASHWKELDHLDLSTFGKMLTDFKDTVIKPLFEAMIPNEDNIYNGIAKAFRGAISKVNFKTILSGSQITDSISNGFTNLKDNVIKKIGLDDIFTAAIVGADLYAVKKIVGLLGNFSDMTGVISKVGNALAGTLGSITKYFKSLRTAINVAVIKNIAVAIGIMVASLIALAYVPTERLDGAIKTMAELAGVLAGLALAVGLMNKLSKGTSGLDALGLIGVAIAMGIMYKLVKNLSELTYGDALRGAVALGEIALVLIGVLGLYQIMTRLTRTSWKTMAGLFGLIGFAIAMRIVIDNIVQLKDKLNGIKMKDISDQLQLLFNTFAVLAVASLPFIAGGFGAGVGMLAAVASLHLLINAIDKIANIDVKTIHDNLDAFITIFIMLGAIMTMSRFAGANAAKGGAAVLQVSIALFIIIEAIKMLADINNRDLARGLISIGLIMLIFAGIIKASKFAGEHAAKAGIMMILMSVAIGILVGSMYLLSVIARDQKVFWRALGAISVLGLIMAAIIGVAKYGETSGKALAMIGVLVAVIVALAGAIYILSSIKDQDAMVRAATALGGLMLMFALMEVASKFAGAGKNSLAGMGMLLGVVSVLALILGVMSTMELSNVVENAEALSLLMVAFSTSMFIMSKIGPLAGAAMSGIAKLAAALILISGIIITIGGIIGSNDKLLSFVQNSIPALEAIGQGLGGLIGGFIGGIGAGISSSFVTVGKNLRAGLDEIIPALESLSNIENADQIFKGISAISSIVTAFGGAELKDAFANLLNGLFGGNDAATFGDKLKDFVSIFEDFPKIDEATIGSAEMLGKAGKALADFASAVPNEGGFLAKLIGDNNNLSSFGDQLAGFAESISGIDAVTSDDVTSLSNLADAGSALARFANSVGNKGGEIAKLIGDNNQLGLFGSQCAAFAEEVSGIDPVTTDDVTSLTNLADAGTAVAKFAKKVGNISTAGTRNGSTYGLASLGASVKMFAIGISGIRVTEADAAAIAILPGIFDSFGLIADTLKQNYMVFNALYQDQTLTNFVTGISSALPSLKELDTNLTAIDFTAVIANIGELSDALTGLTELIHSISGGEGKLLSDLTAAFSDFASKGVAAFEEGLTAASSADSISKSVSNLVSSAKKQLDSPAKQAEFQKAGDTLMSKFKSGLSSYSSDALAKACTSHLSTVVARIRLYHESFYNAGSYLGQGYVQGIELKVTPAYNAGFKLGAAGAKGVNDGQQSQSPSKLAIQSGRYLGEGYVMGISDWFTRAASTGEYLAKSTLTSMASTLSDVGSLVDGNLDIHPTISPVIDRESVLNSLNAVGNSISTSKASTLSANISGTMDANNVVLDYISKLDAANSSRNDKVLSAFDKLSDDILTLGDRIDNLELRLDGDKLVGGIAKRADRVLGTRAILDKRGL